MKEKNGFVTLCKVIGVTAIMYSAGVAVKTYLSKKAGKLEQENQGQKEKKYLCFMDGKGIKVKEEEVEKIEIDACMGGVTLDLTEAYIARDVELKVKAVMSGIEIKVPPMVHVVLEGTNVMSGFSNMVPIYEKEEIPTISVFAECVMSGISVQMIP